MRLERTILEDVLRACQDGRVELNPAQFKLLLAGPKVSRLMPFVTQRGYYADGCTTGSETLDLLRQSPVHVLLVELELDDMLLADLVQIVRNESLAGAVILLDDPAKSGLIVSQLIRGVDGYVATPPDEQYLFRIIERQLLAQWAVAQMAQGSQDAADKQRLEKAVANERSKVTELVKEIASLRDQLTKSKKARGSPMDVPDTQLNMAKKRPVRAADDDDDDDDSEAVTLRAARAVATHARSEDFENNTDTGQDDRTSPAGFSPPPGVRDGFNARSPGRDTGFDDIAHTKPSQGSRGNMNKIIPGFGDDELNADDLADDDDESATAADDGDLFLELEDPTDNQATQQPPKPKPTAAKKPAR
jgi:DNA-binding response OmpR family regulator